MWNSTFLAEGRPSFNLLRNDGSTVAPLYFFVFDLLILKGKDIMDESLVDRRKLLEKHVRPKLDEPFATRRFSTAVSKT